SDVGGGAVAGVEVSVDGGTTWHPAHGSSTWSYDWTPGSLGNAVIRTRGIDDSGNLEAAGPGIIVNVVQGDCPCTSLWKPSAVPPIPDFGDGTALELGVKFKSDIDGFITGIRYYKSVSNSGTHVGNLWKTDGTQLATATFSGESQSGWQQVLFATPVAITANTIYVASYHTNVGHYAATPGYFNTASVDSPPLHALPTNSVGGNGVFSVGDSAFPANTFNGANYWVDVVFATSTVDSTPPVLTNLRAKTIDSSKVQVSWSTDEASTSKLEYSTDFSFPAAGTVVINETMFATSHTVTVPNLTPNTTYYYRVTATDATGNSAMSASPSFTVPGPTLRDTAIADFEAGTHQNTYSSMTFDGEAILSPAAGSEFSGPGLSPGWIAVPWGPGGFSLIDSGVLIVDGARVATCALVNGQCQPEDTSTTQSATFTAPRTLEFSARFSGDQFQHAGLGVTFSTGQEPWAIFSTLNGGALFARTNTGIAGSIDTLIGAGLLGQFHRYRIDWTPTAVNYFVDGVPVASHPLAVAGPMR
ncbi:MAG TPA: DUF4082 domain-containing protein, partial [Ilumatobacteraceae bacterium]|nr:DUF4082 domain-containing protein [Ilumatobacteraceae bacterium]